ncbi:hypothetical protein AGMMS49936_01780 [Endomicrobiia bacterium]|nr:hypothetical protein AGMMS49936_01780 [Endomicrobiia bacterium]
MVKIFVIFLEDFEEIIAAGGVVRAVKADGGGDEVRVGGDWDFA